jgi:hypothetical protein
LLRDRVDLGVADRTPDERAQIFEIAGAKRQPLRLGVGHRAVEVEGEDGTGWIGTAHLDL